MEVRQYVQVIRRRMWVVVSVFLIVLVVGALRASSPAPMYQASMRFLLGVRSGGEDSQYFSYDGYYTWLTSEYLLDDVAQLVQSRTFAEAVSQRLASQGLAVSAASISGATQTGQLHRILSVSVASPDPSQLERIALAVAEILPTEIERHFAQVGAGTVYASVIDPPAVYAIGASLRQKLDLPLRLMLAILAGVVLAFVLDYLDDTVRDARELETAGLCTLGEIPSTQGLLATLRFSRRRSP